VHYKHSSTPAVRPGKSQCSSNHTAAHGCDALPCARHGHETNQL
jgi:hypothetical protein